MSNLRTALIGYGLAGRVLHRPLIEAVPGIEVTHVVSRDPVRREQARDDLPGVRLVATADELWACQDEFEAVVVATDNDVHAALATTSLDLGKSTVVDKPLTVDAEDAAQLCKRARDLGVLLTVFHNRRWDSDTRTARALIAEGTLGEIHRLESRFTRHRPQVSPHWRERAASGGGVLLDLGSHLVDQALYLLGPAVAVYAQLDVRRPGAVFDDDCFLALTHASGARSHLWCSLAAPWPGPRLVLQGSAAGWAKHDLDGQEQALRDGVPADAPRAPEPPGRLWTADGARNVASLQGDWSAFYRGFVAAVRDGGAPPVAPEAGVRVLQVIEAARQSSGLGAVVRLPSVQPP